MLIDDIIQLLSDDKGRLTDALLKTKVLLHKIGKKELTEWVNHELNGYPDTVEVPAYRVLQSKLVGNASNGALRYSKQPLPVGHLKPELQSRYMHAELRQSLSILEQFDHPGTLAREIPPEAYRRLNEGLGGGYKVERAWCETPAHDVLGILTQVRSRLLDFALELKDSVGDEVTDEGIKHKADAVDTSAIFRHAVFGSIGDNATIILGSQNSVAVQNEVCPGDFASLAHVLTREGIPSDEVQSLQQAMKEDETTGNVTLSEGKTGGWFLKLLGRAAEGGLKIGTDVVSRVVTNALTAYLGGSG